VTRVPLRPLARILAARSRGENPDAIERENRRLRHESLRDRERQRAESRITVLAIFFLAGFALVGLRMGVLAATAPSEPRAEGAAALISSTRADIVDRQGRVLATNLATHSLYAHPQDMVDPRRAAEALAGIFPDLDAEALARRFTDGRKFLWVRKTVSPEQRQAVHDIGEPGLLFGPREMRLYPNGKLAAHVLGGASFGREGVHSAEVIGVAGLEKALDARLRDPALAHEPLRLSIDVTIQSAARRVLEGGMKLMNAKGAAAVLMDARTGEIAAMVSLPDFDPNDRPRPLVAGEGAAGDSPLFNRAVQGVYELGSALKILTVAQALDERLVSPSTVIDTSGPLTWGRYRIRDFRNYGPRLSVTDVIVKSSNIGTARIALQIGAERQRAFLGRLGLLDPTAVELVEAAGAAPLLPPRWSEISTMTVSYGHGLSISPLHLAAAYATLANGGTRVTPTLLARDDDAAGPRVVSEAASAAAIGMLRQVVERGTASFGEVEGYAVAGKTGTADKPKPTGGYFDDRVIATFASVFPAHDPEWVLVVSLDEPVETSGDEPRRTAGWTAVPVAAELIRRVAPLLGLRPIEAGAVIALIGEDQ
jgi:cell division protein FtsI (penicillin-binding protein 3)